MRLARIARAVAASVLGGAVAGAAFALDANTATQAELEAIRGVGPALAARIVEARRTQPFVDLDDLKARVRGIGDANLRRMREAGLAVSPSGRVQTFIGQAPARAKRERVAGRSAASPDAPRR
jgi:competence protein ComEA